MAPLWVVGTYIAFILNAVVGAFVLVELDRRAQGRLIQWYKSAPGNPNGIHAVLCTAVLQLWPLLLCYGVYKLKRG